CTQAIAAPNGSCGICDVIPNAVLRLADCDRHRYCETALSCTAKSAITDNLCGHSHIGVGKDDHMVFGAALALRPFAVRACSRIDIFRYRGRADKAESAHFGMVEKGVHSRFPAIQKVDDARREADLIEQLKGPPHGERHTFRRLQD